MAVVKINDTSLKESDIARSGLESHGVTMIVMFWELESQGTNYVLSILQCVLV